MDLQALLPKLQSKYIPANGYHRLTFGIFCLIFGMIYAPSPVLPEPGPICTWYLRYDQKFSNHCLTQDYLLMVPAEQDYRKAEFSRIHHKGVINMTDQMSTPEMTKQAKEATLKSILQNHGLKSVTALDLVTIVSFEGMIDGPVNIRFDETKEGPRLGYRAVVRFSPLPFPDQWHQLKKKSETKKFLNDLLLLLQ